MYAFAPRSSIVRTAIATHDVSDVRRSTFRWNPRRTSYNQQRKRQNIGRLLLEIFRTAVNNGTKFNVTEIMQCVKYFVEDPHIQVRLDLVEQLPHVAMICEEAPYLYGNILHDYLLDIILKYLQDVDIQVRQATQAGILMLMNRGLLDNDTIEAKVCPVIEILCRSVDFINTAVSLMSKMAPLIGKELTEKIFLDKYITLCRDKELYVRRICVTHFGTFFASVGKKAMNCKLFPTYTDMCHDKVWGIRKACVDVMMPVACCTTLLYRRTVCAELMATHLNDESKWVRMSAFQILGPFISTFAKEFTDITYNQHCELVFTSRQDARFSVRYAYEGIFPMKSLTLNINYEEHCVGDLSVKRIFEEEDDEDQSEDRISLMRAFRSKIQKERSKASKLEETTDDIKKYSPFLYYYIAPDLPPDDELVKAAKKSTAQENVHRKSMDNTRSSKASTINDVLNKESFPAVEFPVVEYPALPELSTNESPVDEIGVVINWDVQDIVPQHLIDSFLSMVEPEECIDVSTDLPHYCAFSFPAVVLTLGKENWSYLKQAYQALASANQYKVRSTLASSIHEIAAILGPELTATDLVPIYNGFIKDLDEVRIGVLKHLATFLKILKPNDRSQYLMKLKQFLATDNIWNWRYREELVAQLLEMVNLFDPYNVECFILPLALEFLGDKVAAVRQIAVSLITHIVSYLSNNERLVTTVFQELKCILGVYARKWVGRQTFAYVCAHLITNNAISGDRFSREMLPHLLKFSTDEVPNVRLAVARTLSKNVTPMGPGWLGIEQAERVAIRLREMRSDPDRDVRIFAGSDEAI
ncbi:serine/threonine-protein phosphatase 4 regulatory subunit 1 isoform X2 [Colletes latitarsis]|uniref:serine/threonine-protein phosphatase 4 regulatory subunit 1 isoform X2 n=1 Tax=Colletes latitarsis TaxID=2605962 RepID=UPI00403715A9